MGKREKAWEVPIEKAMIQVKGLHKTFFTESGRVQAIRDVNFDVAKGEAFTLLGPSGCGKTTLLRSIAGLERPDDGELTIGEQVVFGDGGDWAGGVDPAATYIWVVSEYIGPVSFFFSGAPSGKV